MGRWSQSRRRGGSSGSLATLAAPVLIADGDPDLEWSWLGTDPDHWDLESSADGVSAWSVYDVIAGNLQNSNTAIGGQFYRIIGRDAGGTATTGYSNVVLQT